MLISAHIAHIIQSLQLGQGVARSPLALEVSKLYDNFSLLGFLKII